jgi:polar amino acid transport system substrate-binding protein
MNRVEGLEDNYPNLVRIDTPVCKNTYAMYMLKENQLNAINELANLKLCIKQGNIPLENIFKSYSPHKLSSYKQLVEMLIAQHCDVIAMTKTAFNNAINSEKNRVAIQDIVPVPYPLPIVYGYHYLHKKHIKLIPSISEELAFLELTGYIEKTNDKF